jgi:threonine aldolase
MIDLRSDTLTQPTPAMRQAIAEAKVGDEQKREDPTVLELERRAAELLGHEDAVFLPTATMANQIALKLLSRPGDVLIAERHSHVLVYEYGGPAVHAGLMIHAVDGIGGRVTADALRAAVPERTKAADQAPTLVALEDTHNNAGGRVWPLAELRETIEAARQLGLAVHLDGARLMNAAVALGCIPSEIAADADTVTLCLSKGLGCPLGAVLASSSSLVVRARVEKHLFGGAMRQAGIVAAAGLHALDHHVERLADDHARARRLAEGLGAGGVPVEVERVETNFVQIDVAELGLERADALTRLREAGVGLSATIHPTVIRAVTHLDVTDDDISRALDVIPAALGVGARAQRLPDAKNAAATTT